MFTEKDIIEIFFQNFKENIVYNSDDAKKIFDCVYKKEMWEHWTDSSGKNDPPPDFFSDKFKLMMDVMEVVDDEKKKGVNSKIREKKIEQAFRAKYIIPDNVRIVVNAAPNKEICHNYKNYCKHFERVVNEHINSQEYLRKKNKFPKYC